METSEIMFASVKTSTIVTHAPCIIMGKGAFSGHPSCKVPAVAHHQALLTFNVNNKSPCCFKKSQQPSKLEAASTDHLSCFVLV